MGNFNNVSMGNGVFYYDNEDVGFLKGNVQFRYNYEIADFEVGVPAVLEGLITRRAGAILRVPVAELTGKNFSMALGGLTITAMEAQTVVTVTDQQLVFAAYVGGTLEAVVADNGTLSTGANKPVVKNQAGDTTYVENTDYLVDYVRGVIFRNPGGAIAAGATVKVTYKYTPYNVDRVKLGATFTLAQKNLRFVHTQPNTSKLITIVMWKAQVTGQLDFTFSEDNFIINEVEFRAIADRTAHADSPYGYIDRER